MPASTGPTCSWRPNPRRDALAQILAFLEPRRGQPGIIYCGTRKQCDELTVALHLNGWPALPYHAGLADRVRCQNQQRFVHEDAPLMVATVAFGMGINRSNVRFVLHAHLPKDLESYYQEIGRAGRDGLPADCLLLYTWGDVRVHRHFIDEGAASERPGRQARLNAVLDFAETRDCRRVPLLDYFGETLAPPCGQCDFCAPRPEAVDTPEASPVARRFPATLDGGERGLVPVARLSDPRGPSCPTAGHDPELFERLRLLRKQLAEAAAVPAYVVFSDRALVEMATHLPQTAGEFLAVNGVGQAKLEKYGTAFLDVIRTHCTEHGLAPQPGPPLLQSIVRPPVRRRFHDVGERFRRGQSVDEIARHFGVARGTVIQHLGRFIHTGNTWTPSGWRPNRSSRQPTASGSSRPSPASGTSDSPRCTRRCRARWTTTNCTSCDC
ncbi:MAG: HRDC domain-containing protein [Verrucomicrobia bacterium]|nr:HRDC domain-containing protein [Verrucomicrobiota bacterium]